MVVLEELNDNRSYACGGIDDRIRLDGHNVRGPLRTLLEMPASRVSDAHPAPLTVEHTEFLICRFLPLFRHFLMMQISLLAMPLAQGPPMQHPVDGGKRQMRNQPLQLGILPLLKLPNQSINPTTSSDLSLSKGHLIMTASRKH